MNFPQNMDKKILFLILLGVLIFTGYPLGHVLAQLTSFCGAGTNTPCVGGIGDLVHNIEITAGFIFGAIAVIMFLVAGILFLTANGAPEKLQAAKSAFIWGIAGVVVGIIAFSIIAIVSSFITQTPQTQTQQPQNQQSQTPQCTDHSQKKCVSNQLFWYNSCGVQQEFIPCSNGCSGSTNDCNPQTQTPQAQSR